MRDKFDLKELTNEIPLGEFLKYDEPLLVSRTNAVSGKLLLASEMSRFDTVVMIVQLSVSMICMPWEQNRFFFMTIFPVPVPNLNISGTWKRVWKMAAGREM